MILGVLDLEVKTGACSSAGINTMGMAYGKFHCAHRMDTNRVAKQHDEAHKRKLMARLVVDEFTSEARIDK